MEEIEILAAGEKHGVELADSLIRKFWGLSFRSEGKMLFDFGVKTNAFIDMMLLSDPLYLYFLDSERKVIEKMEAEPWGFDPRSWKLYRPDRKYRYLLESFEELELDQGDTVDFEL
ncbi:hypothetical protein [Candidatus Nanohalococcus occultus]|uniref:hypothetical protein n=1 Tax=Candidatus Nanohalococcus occultus TaxID=2978047 RepID=UPI0039E0D197